MRDQPIRKVASQQMDHSPSNIRFKDVFNFLNGEPAALKNVLSGMNWRQVSLLLGLCSAITHLVLICNPGICYLFAADKVKGMVVTLPEAMSSVEAWGWYNLLLMPLLFLAVSVVAAFIIHAVSCRLKGEGPFFAHLGMVVIMAGIVLTGQITGYFIINSASLKGLSDLRDLTPGVGLGLLPFFTRERIGIFYWEIVRGFDLFGIWAILLSAAIFKIIDHFNIFKSFSLSFLCYIVFIVVRWAGEGPIYRLWHYFWTTGSV